jgi:Leucine-rich repeat (LRR) protein
LDDRASVAALNTGGWPPPALSRPAMPLKQLTTLPEQPEVQRVNGGFEAIALTQVNTVVRRLTLNTNQLSSLGTLHSHAPNLSYLSVSANVLTHQGLRDVHKLVKLVTLILSQNRLEKVPRTLSKLPCLQALILNGNTISKLPPLEIPTLSALVLSKNCLKAVAPEVLAGLPNLAKLSLSHNELSVVPDVSHNRLLHELRLNGNAITRVPALAENVELVLLDVGGNKLSDGWAAVAELQTPKLKNLSLRANCPELDVPSEDLQERFPFLVTCVPTTRECGAG